MPAGFDGPQTPSRHSRKDGFLAQRPSLAALSLALIPWTAMCASVAFWDRIRPMVLGLPFNFFWLFSWTLLTPVCMWGAYRMETSRRPKPSAGGAEGESRPP